MDLSSTSGGVFITQLKLGFTYQPHKSIPLPQSSFQTFYMVISLGRLLCLLIASWYSLKAGSIFGFDIDVYTGQNISDRTSIFLILVEFQWILQKKHPHVASQSIPDALCLCFLYIGLHIHVQLRPR